MAAGAKFEVKLKSIMGGQNFLNIFYYEQMNGILVGAVDLRVAFNTTVMPKIRQVTSEEWYPYLLEVQNLSDGLDYNITSLSGAGSVVGDWIPLQNAWSFNYINQNKDFKGGGKRFGGIAELSQAKGIPTTTMLVYLKELETVLESSIVASGVTFNPRIRNTVPVVGTPIYNGVSSVNFTFLSTQNSRKTNTAPGF